MDKIGNYGIQNGYYNGLEGKKDSAKSRAKEAKDAGSARKTDGVELSSNAKKLLKELQKTYSNMDFMVADFENDEEAASYLSRGTGEYSVLISPDELEKMASDDKVKEKNLNILDEAVEKLDDMKKQLADKGEGVTRIGMVLGDDGKISYFAELEKVSEKQRERIEHQREARKEEAQKAADRAEKKKAGWTPETAGYQQKEPVKRTMVYADSVEELGRKIGQVDWNAVKEERQSDRGSHFDLTI